MKPNWCLPPSPSPPAALPTAVGTKTTNNRGQNKYRLQNTESLFTLYTVIFHMFVLLRQYKPRAALKEKTLVPHCISTSRRLYPPPIPPTTSTRRYDPLAFVRRCSERRIHSRQRPTLPLIALSGPTYFWCVERKISSIDPIDPWEAARVETGASRQRWTRERPWVRAKSPPPTWHSRRRGATRRRFAEREARRATLNASTRCSPAAVKVLLHHHH